MLYYINRFKHILDMTTMPETTTNTATTPHQTTRKKQNTSNQNNNASTLFQPNQTKSVMLQKITPKTIINSTMTDYTTTEVESPTTSVAVEEKKTKIVRSGPFLDVLKVVFGLIGGIIALVFIVGGLCTCYKIKSKNNAG